MSKHLSLSETPSERRARESGGAREVASTNPDTGDTRKLSKKMLEPQKQIVIRIPASLHKRVRRIALDRDETVTSIITEYLKTLHA